jgi:hypothetical protein
MFSFYLMLSFQVVYSLFSFMTLTFELDCFSCSFVSLPRVPLTV